MTKRSYIRQPGSAMFASVFHRILDLNGAGFSSRPLFFARPYHFSILLRTYLRRSLYLLKYFIPLKLLAMNQQFDYVTKLDVRFSHLERMDVTELVADCTDKWFNQTLTLVNDSVVRLGIVEGEYHWHKHDNDDEFFFVLQGQLLIDMEDHTIELNPQQGVTISKGVLHRPRAPKKTVMLMVETSAIQPTGD
jgi:mannose-6-phosphate isomerase-like protein (cupin superfamily)